MLRIVSIKKTGTINSKFRKDNGDKRGHTLLITEAALSEPRTA